MQLVSWLVGWLVDWLVSKHEKKYSDSNFGYTYLPSSAAHPLPAFCIKCCSDQ